MQGVVSEAVHVVPICDGLPTGFLPEDEGPSALTPNAVELIPCLGALSPPRRARPGPSFERQPPVRARVCPARASRVRVTKQKRCTRSVHHCEICTLKSSEIGTFRTKRCEHRTVSNGCHFKRQPLARARVLQARASRGSRALQGYLPYNTTHFPRTLP